MNNEKKISNSILEYIKNKDDNEIIIVKPALRNFSKQQVGQISAEIIKTDLEKEIAKRLLNNTINILKVEFFSALIDQDQIEDIEIQENFNDYKNVPFLVDLFEKQKALIKVNPNQNLQKQEQQEDDMQFDEVDDPDATFIDINQKKPKMNKLDEINKFLARLQGVLIADQPHTSAKQLKESTFQEDPINSKIDSPVTITIQLRKKELNSLVNFQFCLTNNRMPVYLNFERAVILNDQLQFQEYSVKMGKRPLSPINMSLYYVLGEDLSKSGINIDPKLDISLFLHSYFKFSSLQKFIQPISIEMFYHAEDSVLCRRVEFVMNFLSQYLLKIEFDLVNCQYCFANTDSSGKNLYFKLLCPPIMSVSIITKRKYELFNIKTDWIRVDNILLNAHYEKYKNELERLIIINNTVIGVNLGQFDEESKQGFQYVALLKKLKEFQILTTLDLALNLKERNSDLDTVFKELREVGLPFEVKYNILCAVGQNRITQPNFIPKMIVKIKQAIDNKIDVQVIEATFQSFIRYSTNVNTSFRISDLNNINLTIFNRDLKKLQEEMIISNQTNKKSLAMIKRVSLTPSGYIYNVKLPEETSSIIRDNFEKLDYFIRLHFEDENMETIHGVQYVTDYFYQKKLQQGIEIFGQQFRLLTWSASQLRGGSCWMFEFKQARMTRQMFIDQIGDFKTLSLDQIAKNAARLGQGFSSSRPIEFKQLNVEVNQPDLQDEDGKLYTDGIGKISPDLIKTIRQELGNQTISAIQIRYHGAKGVLLLNDKLPESTIQLRKSMVKFNPSLLKDGKYQNEIALLDYNKFRGGYLNRQIIILLRTLGIEDQVFMDLQKSYLTQIENLSAIDSSIYKHFNVDNTGELQGLTSVVESIRLLVNSGQNDTNNQYVKNVMGRLKRRGLMQLRTKCNILVEKAARVLGVVDDYELLNENEVVCIVRPNIDKPEEYLEGEIIVTRNPCLHPGDIRKVTAISAQEIIKRNTKSNPYSQYFNCIVFPCKGKSLPAQCGGGDLDGDIYFVAWDKRLIPDQMDNPMVYDEEKKPENQQKKPSSQGFVQTEQFFQEDKMVEFILQYLNYDVLGKIDNSHLAFADRSIDFAKDKNCMELAQLHSAAVDYVKHGFKVIVPPELISKEWPDFMEKENKLITYQSQSILGKLYRDVLTRIEEEQPIARAGFHQKGLQDINPNFMYRFNFDNTELVEVEVNQQDLLEQIQKYIYQYCNQENLFRALKCLNHIFESLDSLCNMYDIKNEYEIYTGYFVNFTKGEGTRLKRRLNIENVQKRVILSVIQLKSEIDKILATDEKRLAQISLIHFFLSYSPDSFDPKRNSKALNIFVEQLFEEIKQIQDVNYQLSRLKNKFLQWYRGCSWFFFAKELMKFLQEKQANKRKQNEQVAQADQSQGNDQKEVENDEFI